MTTDIVALGRMAYGRLAIRRAVYRLIMAKDNTTRKPMARTMSAGATLCPKSYPICVSHPDAGSCHPAFQQVVHWAGVSGLLSKDLPRQ
jgi:hypothetical protein